MEDVIITDDEIQKAFEGTNFGSENPRDVVANSLLQYACGYHTGHTATMICKELGLVTQNPNILRALPVLTKRGRAYLWESFKNFKTCAQ